MASTLFMLNTMLFLVAAYNATGIWTKLWMVVSVACSVASVYCAVKERRDGREDV